MDNTNALKISDFDYYLPPELIAQTPIEPRDASRLLVVHRASGTLEHRHFYEIGAYLRPGDLLIANQSRVLPARLLGRRAETGGAVEVLLLAERLDLGPDHWETLVHPGRRLREGARIVFGDGDDASLHAEILQRTEAGGRIVRFFVDPTPSAPGHYLPLRQGPSLPDCFGVVPHLAPTRAHPPPTQPRATTFRMTAPPPDDGVVGRRSGRGGQATCSGTGWLGGCGGPLWVPGGGTNRNVSGRERQGPCPPDRVPQGITPTIHDEALSSPQASTGIRQLIGQLGRMPLPPYIHEPLVDPERYQTVYARIDGSAAAPTAGLHFTPQLLEQLRRQGVRVGFVTLHVGLDTFKPVECEDVGEHKMHSEAIDLDAPTAELINETRRVGGRIIAVGTTSVRVLESVANVAGFHEGESSQLRIDPYCGHTRLFITPGYRFRVVDALITNFHLPRSTLLLLVSAFAGKALIEKAYREAILERYRFFSFGDAMLLL